MAESQKKSTKAANPGREVNACSTVQRRIVRVTELREWQRRGWEWERSLWIVAHRGELIVLHKSKTEGLSLPLSKATITQITTIQKAQALLGRRTIQKKQVKQTGRTVKEKHKLHKCEHKT